MQLSHPNTPSYTLKPGAVGRGGIFIAEVISRFSFLVFVLLTPEKGLEFVLFVPCHTNNVMKNIFSFLLVTFVSIQYSILVKFKYYICLVYACSDQTPNNNIIQLCFYLLLIDVRVSLYKCSLCKSWLYEVSLCTYMY